MLVEGKEIMCVRRSYEGFPGGAVVKTPCLPCRGCRFDSWLGNQDPTCHMVWQEKKERHHGNTDGAEW